MRNSWLIGAFVPALWWGCAGTRSPVIAPSSGPETGGIAAQESAAPAKEEEMPAEPVARAEPTEPAEPPRPAPAPESVARAEPSKPPPAPQPAAKPTIPAVTLESLLAEMTDLAALSEFPHPAYSCRQFSSYDRASKSPSEDWFANRDRGHHLRVEERDGRKEFVMMDAAGPGAIVRIWSANPQDAGVFRFYIDDDKQPALEVSAADFLHGKIEAFPQPITGMRGRGCNAYFPIPYAKHCKVTADKGDFYYQINYRTYDKQVGVQSFSSDAVEALKEKVAKTARELAWPLEAGGPSDNAVTEEFATSVPPGDPVETTLYGPGAVVELEFRLEAENLEQGLRDLIFEAEFDGKRTIEAPFGDFFGSAPGVSAYQSLPLTVTEDGRLICHWVMPFKDSATLRARNRGGQEITLSGHYAYEETAWSDRSLYFHAKWRIQRDIPTRPFIDWNYLTVEGKGLYVGDALYVANPKSNWWGEGDEKIYVDGETFPSHFGTGTEDYYGYAWGNNTVFHHAYHNQPRVDSRGNYGFAAVNRWHILDAIPFTKSLKFDMEVWHWADDIKITYAQISYWYASAEAKDNYEPITEPDVVLPVLPEREVRTVRGAIEGEAMKVVAKTAELGPQYLGERFSNEHHLWWRFAKPGEKIVLGFSVKDAGRRKIVAELCKANDYGIHQIYVNDQKAGEPLDLYNGSIAPSGPVELGTFDLKAGRNTLVVECVGTNPKANPKSYMFGLDYILLQPAE